MKALIVVDTILAMGEPEFGADRLRMGGQEFLLAHIAGYSLQDAAPGMKQGYVRDGEAWVAPPVPATAEEIAGAIAEIDRTCDTKRNRYVSTGSLVVEEYRLAAKQAAAYKAAGYSGQVPASVQSWATAKGWTATQAADDILATEAAWMAVLAAIRNIRLPAKEQARAATTQAQVRAILVGVRAALAQIPEA